MIGALFSQSVLPVIEGHNPAGTSVATVSQYAQGYNYGTSSTILYYSPSYTVDILCDPLRFFEIL